MHEPLAVYCLNRAVATFGLAVDNDIEKSIEGKKGAAIEATASNVLNKWIGTPLKFANPTPTRR